MSSTRYRLVRAHRESAPELDESQQAVVDFAGGPLLVLAGPGTGKTTTLVEAVVERIERRGLQPDQVLLLTFSRKAAESCVTAYCPARPHDRDAAQLDVPRLLLRTPASLRVRLTI
jgi:superfamily I DNA/RNA helicase